jgi:hypothetical protein
MTGARDKRGRTFFRKTPQVRGQPADMMVQVLVMKLKWRRMNRAMKVALTVNAEFPASIPVQKIKQLACKLGHPDVRETTAQDHSMDNVAGKACTHRQVSWTLDPVDMADIPSRAMFMAGAARVAPLGIKLTRRIDKVSRDIPSGLTPPPNVYWTWGEGDLMEMIPRS